MINSVYGKILLVALILLVVSFVVFVGFYHPALADDDDPEADTDIDDEADVDTNEMGTGDPNYGNCCPDDESGRVCICDPLNPDLKGNELKDRKDTPEDITIALVGKISAAILAPIGAMAFLFFVIGGFYWIFSAGNEERVKKGRDIMLWTLVGLVVAFSAYALLVFVFNAFGILQK